MSESHAKMIFVAGIGPGMGKTTLARRLAISLGGEHIEDGDLIFKRREFEEVATKFRGGQQPVALELESAWTTLVRSIECSRCVTVLDGSFVTGAEDLDWALASEKALHEHSRNMRAILAPMRPLIFFLDGNVAEGMRRREAQFGRDWFRNQRASDEDWDTRFARIEAGYIANRPRILAAFAAGNWRLFQLDAGLSKDELLEAALEVIHSEAAS